MAVWSYTRSWSAEPAAIAHAREFVVDSLARHRRELVPHDIVLVAGELATNAVRHARTPFSVTLTSLDGVVVVSVRDGVDSPPPVTVVGVHEISGRGLRIVAAYTSAWGVVAEPEGGKSVWAAFGEATLAARS